MRKKVKKSNFWLVFFLVFSVNAIAQLDSVSYTVVFNYDQSKKLEKKTIPEQLFKSPENISKELQKITLALYDQGYASASFDSIVYRNDTALAYLFLGKKYTLKKIDLSYINPLHLRAAGIREKEFKNLPFQYGIFKEVGMQLIHYTENHGFPFASVYLDSIAIIDGEVNGVLKMNLGPLTKIIEIRIHGNAKLNTKYLYNYLSIKPGDIYKEKLIANIDIRLKELPFIDAKKKSAISFTDEGVIIHLFLEHKKNSSFNGIVGVMPNDKAKAVDPQKSSVAFTGDLIMHLSNIVKQGEAFDVKWKGLPNKTQELDLKLNYPFVLNLPVGITAALNLFKQDTSFINHNTLFGVSYLFKGSDYIKAFVNNKGTSLLKTKKPNEGIQNTVQNNSISYGLEVFKEDYNYRLNPTKGYSFLLNSQVGSKTIAGADENGFFHLPVKSNDTISSEIIIPAKSTVYNLSGKTDAYFPFFTFTTFKIALQGGWLINPYLFDNDLYRLGGMKNLRGFTDLSIYASQYLISTAEYRFLLERNSFIGVFIDYAYMEKITMSSRIIDHPFGFGATLSFETKAGIFNISYAVGKQLGNPIDFSAAKIHFGFLNQF